MDTEDEPMKYDKAFFDDPFDRRGTACEKWDALERRQGREMNPMWVADMDFRGPEAITEALMKRAAHPAYGYTEQTESATKAMLDFMKRRHGITLSADEQALLPCVVTGLRAAVLALTKPGDGIIVQPPVYGPFYFSIRDNERTTVECPLIRDENGRYAMDLESVEKACQNGAKMMLRCNPHNPVGHCWTWEELTSLWAILKRYDVALVSDEIHEDFVFERGAFVPMLTLADQPEDRVISLTSASKTFNLAGLQQAVAFAHNKELLGLLEKTMHDVGVVQGNIFGLIAAEAAYTHGDEWLDGMLAYLREGEQVLRKSMTELLPKAVISPLEATYLAWVDLRAYGFTTAELLERCRKAGVEFTPGTFFGETAGEGFLRVNLACQHSRVRLAVEQLINSIIESLREPMTELLARWIQIPSVKGEPEPGAPFGAEVRRCLDVVLEDAKNLGFEVRNFDGYAGDISMGPKGVNPLAILAHLDVVPTGDGWTKQPFGAEIIDGKMYGRGTSDDKGPAAAGLFAMVAAKKLGLPLKREVRLILGCDEESGWECMSYYKEHCDMPKIGFSPDASFPVINTEKGMLHLDLKGAYTAEGLRVKEISVGERTNVVPGLASALVYGDEVLCEKINETAKAMQLDVKAEMADGFVKVSSTGIPSHAAMPESTRNATGQMLLVLNQLGLTGALKTIAECIGMEYDGKGIGVKCEDFSGPLTCNMGILRYNEQDGLYATLDIRYPVLCDHKALTASITAALSPCVEVIVESQKEPHHGAPTASW